MSKINDFFFFLMAEKKMPANWFCFSLPLLSVDSRLVWDEKCRLFLGKWSTLSIVMRKRESKTRKARRRASWPCWASLGPSSTCWSSSLSTSTPPCDSYPPAGWLQLIWTPWDRQETSTRHSFRWLRPPEPARILSPAQVDLSRIPSRLWLQHVHGDGHLKGCGRQAKDCTESFFPMELFPFQTVYLPHGYLISFSQNVFVSVHICIRFKGTYSSSGCFLYSISQCFWINRQDVLQFNKVCTGWHLCG